MWAGTSALQRIDQSLRTVRNESVRLDSHLASLTESLADSQRQKVTIINQIAAVRLSEIEQGELRSSLTNADKKALETLKLRTRALEQLNKKINVLNESVIETEAERESLLEQANNLSDQLVKIESQAQASLKNDANYLTFFSQASDADAVSQEAERKVAQAKEDMSIKAEPYQQDKLFMYLWQRGFGTTEYKGRFISRMIDSWVAGLIKYEASRVNYWNLTEIPKRLTEHAEHVADIADDAHDKLQKLELEVLAKNGALELEAKIDDARAVLDECDDKIESIESQLSDELAKRAKFTAGEDTYIKQSLEVLASALNHDNLQSIERYVRATHSPTDDHLVMELQQLYNRVDDINDNLGDVQSLHRKQLSKLSELESVRRNFKNARFDDVRSGFTNESLLVSVLGQFVQGLVDGADVWQTIKKNQRYRDVGVSPDFGSGALGGLGDILIEGAIDYANRKQRSSRRSTWNLPRSRGSSRTTSRRPSRRRSGGFKTGGGF